MRRLDTSTAPQWFAAIVYGKSGSGKTTLGVTAPRPLILLSEAQGELPIRQAAKRLGVPMPPVLFMETLNDCRAVLRALRGPKDQPFRVFQTEGEGDQVKKVLLAEFDWPETVVLDSTTDIMRLVENEIRQESPPKMGRDGLPVDSERFWNVLGDRCKNVIFGFRDAPVHKLFLCAEDDRDAGEGDDKRRSLLPSLPMRKLPNLLSGAGNFTGYAYRREVKHGEKVEIAYGVMSSGPEYMMLKTCAPLRPVEVADFSYWVRVVRGSIEAAPKAPPASGESLATLQSAVEALAEAVGPMPADAAPAAAMGQVAEAVADAIEVAAEPAPAAPEPPAAPAAARKRKGGK